MDLEIFGREEGVDDFFLFFSGCNGRGVRGFGDFFFKCNFFVLI